MLRSTNVVDDALQHEDALESAVTVNCFLAEALGTTLDQDYDAWRHVEVDDSVFQLFLDFLIRNNLCISEPERLASAVKGFERPVAEPERGESDLSARPSVSRGAPGQLRAYMASVALVLRCKKAAYRLSAAAWDEVCQTILRLPTKGPSPRRVRRKK